MEYRRTEPEFDDLERLLGEIPNGTYENSGANGSVPKPMDLNGEPKSLMNNAQQSPVRRTYPNGAFDLNTAFSELRFAEELAAQPRNRPLETPFQNYAFPSSLPNGFHGFEAPKIGNETANLLRSSNNSQQVSIPGFPFPVMPEQQMVMETQARVSYQQAQINWRRIEEERILNMQRQYLNNFQRLQAQQIDIESRFRFEAQLLNTYEQFKQDPYWNNGYGVLKSSVQSNPEFSLAEINAMKAWERIGNQNYPERMVARPVNESLNYARSVYQPGRLSLGLSDYRVDLYPELTKKPLASRYSLNGVAGKILLMAKDQYGCRFLQRKFSDGTLEEIEMIFDEIIDHVVDLMTDPFGNYLIQKLVEVCNKDQMMKILRSITRNPGELLRISCDMHGTRAVQKIIETLNAPEQYEMIVSALEPSAVVLMKNMNGNHVAQKCLHGDMVPEEYNEFLFAAATMNCVELAKDRHGCCVLQKCLGNSDGERRARLISEVAANALIFAQDPFGNYVVQFVFDLRLPWATNEILDQLDGSFGDLSMQKHSSNVVEQSLKNADEERHVRIIEEIIDHHKFDQIMQDAFGNYVVQAALQRAKGTPLYTKMNDAIKPHIPMLRNSPFGKKVLSSLGLKK